MYHNNLQSPRNSVSCLRHVAFNELVEVCFSTKAPTNFARFRGSAVTPSYLKENKMLVNLF